MGDDVIARDSFEEALTLFRNLKRPRGIAATLLGLGRLASQAADTTTAHQHFHAALVELHRIGNPAHIASAIEAMALLPTVQRRPAIAAQLLGAAAHLRALAGAPLPPIERVENERALSLARTQCAEATFAAAWSEGNAMTIEQASEFALNLLERRDRDPI